MSNLLSELCIYLFHLNQKILNNIDCLTCGYNKKEEENTRLVRKRNSIFFNFSIRSLARTLDTNFAISPRKCELLWWQFSLFLFFCILSLLFTSALVASICANGSQSVEYSWFSVASLCNCFKFDFLSWVCNWKNLTNYLVLSCCWFKLLSSSIVDLTLLRLALTSWEKDKLTLVGVESCNI